MDFLHSLWPILTAICHFGLAVAASLHALLKKTEPRQAILWLTFLWMLPVAGAIFYFMFGINRVRRKAERLRENVPDLTDLEHDRERLPAARFPGWESFDNLLEGLVPRALVHGNRVTPLHGGDSAYRHMLKAIATATRSVNMSSYIFQGDGIGAEFCQALADARERGVEVRVIVDDAGRRYTKPSAWSVLRELGVPVQRFAPRNVIARLTTLNLRNHRKLLIVDGRLGFTGGINIRDYHLSAAGENQVMDTHFEVEGPIVKQLMEIFAEDWAFCTEPDEILTGPQFFPQLEATGDVWACGIADGPDENFMQLPTAFQAAVEQARERLWIQTPYFLPDSNLMSTLRVAALRGVDVRILLPRMNNIGLVKWAAESYYEALVGGGVQVRESYPLFDHSKVLIVDNVLVAIGSANWDPRSLVLNFEFNLFCFDRTLNTELSEPFERRWNGTEAITPEQLRQWTMPRRLRNGIARLASPYI